MYRGEAYLHHDRINSVLRTAEVLQVKGLSEGPKSFELNNQGLHGTTSSSNNVPTSTPRSTWSPPLHPNNDMVQRSSVGIMGNIKRKERDRDRDFHHPHHRLNDRDMDGPLPSHRTAIARPMSPDHGLSSPYGYSHSARDPPFSIYGNAAGAFRGIPPFPRQQQDACSSSYSPGREGGRSSVGVKSEGSPPQNLTRNSYNDGKFTPPQAHSQAPNSMKEERDDPYDLVRSTSNNGSNSGNRSDIVDRRTPSDKERHTPAQGSQGGDFDNRSRHSPSPAPTPGSVGSVGKASSFPSDSTTDLKPQNNDDRSLLRPGYNEGHIRRASDAASDAEANSISGDRPSKFTDFRASGEDLQRGGSPSRKFGKSLSSDFP